VPPGAETRLACRNGQQANRIEPHVLLKTGISSHFTSFDLQRSCSGDCGEFYRTLKVLPAERHGRRMQNIFGRRHAGNILKQ